MSIDGALDRLDWFAADLDDLTGALRALAADPEGAARRVPLDPRIAPLAFAARLPDGARALREFGDALQARRAHRTDAGRGARRARRAMVRCAGVLDDPRFDVTLFDASPGLLHNAHAYFTRTMPTLQAMQDDLLPARHLGRFDCVISFAAAHCVTIRARRSGSRQRCWRSMAACCSPTCCAIRRCANSSRA